MSIKKKTQLTITIEQKQMWRISSTAATGSFETWQTDKPALLKKENDKNISQNEFQKQSRKWKVLLAIVRAVNYAFHLLERSKGGR